MAQAAFRLDREKLSCSICLDLLKDPVTIPCGHNYCMGCIKKCWDEKQTYSCPQCRQSFRPRPALMKNTMLAELVEELKKAGLADASPDHSYAGPADVACDFCVGRQLKAFKSCLACMASYCELHLQPHFSMAPLKKHKLVEATSKLQDNICPRHDEVMKIFCRTDRQCICYLCSMDEHKGHDTVSAAAERAERQMELGVDRRNIQQRIQDREKDVKVMQQRLEAIGVSADKAVSDSEKIFRELICLIEKKSSEVKQKIRSQQKTDESRVKELQEEMQQEISELRRKDTELEKLSSTEDHLHFLTSYPSLSHLSQTTRSPSLDDFSVQYYEQMSATVSEARDKLKALLSDKWPKISLGKSKDVLQDTEYVVGPQRVFQFEEESMEDEDFTEPILWPSSAFLTRPPAPLRLPPVKKPIAVRPRIPPAQRIPAAARIPPAQRIPAAQRIPPAQRIPAAQRIPPAQRIPAAAFMPSLRIVDDNYDSDVCPEEME